MIDPHKRPRVTLRERDSGLDVWLPAIVAIIAAIFMLTNAHAQEAAPRALYDADRFAAASIAREAADAEAARAAASYTATHTSYVATSVAVSALPELAPVAATESMAPGPASVVYAIDRSVVIQAENNAPISLGRLIAPIGIAALLLLALVALARTWRRTEPLAV